MHFWFSVINNKKKNMDWIILYYGNFFIIKIFSYRYFICTIHTDVYILYVLTIFNRYYFKLIHTLNTYSILFIIII